MAYLSSHSFFLNCDNDKESDSQIYYMLNGNLQTLKT